MRKPLGVRVIGRRYGISGRIMRIAGRDHDRGSPGQVRKRKPQQQVMSEVIDGERRFKALGRPLAEIAELRAGIKHEHVNRRASKLADHRLGEGPDARQRRPIEGKGFALRRCPATRAE